jgi:ABC-type multidrug transport system fused ATPase/permease subunit
MPRIAQLQPEVQAELGDLGGRLESVSVRYRVGGPLALDDVWLQSPRRGHTALVGPSGAGKSTVLSLLLKFLHPVEGRLRLDGAPYDDWTADAVRSRIG